MSESTQEQECAVVGQYVCVWPHLSLVLQWEQRKQVVWYTCVLATRRSSGYTVFRHDTQLS